jgi:hypothetical protein
MARAEALGVAWVGAAVAAAVGHAGNGITTGAGWHLL